MLYFLYLYFLCVFDFLCVCFLPLPVRWKVVDHYVGRLCGSMQLLQQQDIVGRTSELARVFGIQFYHVLTRGSQVPTNHSPPCSGASQSQPALLVPANHSTPCWYRPITAHPAVTGQSQTALLVPANHSTPCSGSGGDRDLGCHLGLTN